MRSLCLEAPCPHPATYRGRCQRHSRQRNRETSPNKSIYNTARWKHTRKRKLFLNPICELCDQELATEVHHDPLIEDLIARGKSPFDMKHLVSSCKSCHSRETRREQQEATR